MGNEKYIKEMCIFVYHQSILESKSTRVNDGIQDFNPPSVLPGSVTSSPATMSPSSTNIQYVVFCSSKEARVRHLSSLIWKRFHCVCVFLRFTGRCITITSVFIQTENLRITWYIRIEYNSCISG